MKRLPKVSKSAYEQMSHLERAGYHDRRFSMLFARLKVAGVFAVAVAVLDVIVHIIQAKP
jgi:hypothetical protein